MSNLEGETQVLSLGDFQFRNIVENKVPFIFIPLSEYDFKKFFHVIYLSHIRNQILVDSDDPDVQLKNLESINAELKKRNVDNLVPILVACETGLESMTLAKKLSELGYQNCYFLRDGFASLNSI